MADTLPANIMVLNDWDANTTTDTVWRISLRTPHTHNLALAHGQLEGHVVMGADESNWKLLTLMKSASLSNFALFS